MRILFLIACLLLTGCTALHTAQDSWSGQDKAQHFIASAIFSAAGNEYGQRHGMSRDRSAGFGFIFSISAGAGKEWWDSRPGGTGWSWKDFIWDIAGASTGYAIWQLSGH
ncbi:MULTISPECIES: YfiM family lipoprotein [Tenebrionibacter/Tenebrionicola group]|jgi:putative lipoprotein|uniref:YfiM family lipoprotein n=2 Tax=Tenebrionibacter/Tenebrionicola group TaxID=2969848 RepID=A0A8K0Y0G9_9ENTR|nr:MULTISPECIES: YfiM family lipoprotein [Tenebrionibacter/Tenebrionicola group]MBK4716614.1 YfiM family lipoprotein [Tenebrionibacter intestinalis]MBV4411675.1 YfiM family lipoprotein [Tenebrionicola larvae]MBV5097282.1 YfiM family lipoprotein [Tenebrionicola larvae]